MKLDKNKIQTSIGKNPSKTFYKLQLLLKDHFPENLKTKYPLQTSSGIFTGDNGQIFTDETEKIIYLGLGDSSKVKTRGIAQHFFQFGEKLRKWNGVGLEIHLPKILTTTLPANLLIYQIINSLEQGAYAINVLAKEFKENSKKIGNVSFILQDAAKIKEAEKGLKRGKVVSRYVNGARFIAHLPANHFTPEDFVSRSKEIAKENGLKITVFDEPQLKKEKMGGILSVCEGSDKKAKMILLEYTPAKPSTKKKLAIIGKGLTFDSGGISIKPAQDMHEMKYDMCGAAAAIHAIGAIAELGLGVPVIAAIGVAENMPDAAAIKPGDVYTAHNGITVEVQNTDAEGRLVLGDVLSYVGKKFKPDYMLDLATLTGAIIISLGHEAAGVMSNSEPLTNLLKEASASSDERIWEMPLWEEYSEDLKSDIADIRNIAGRAGGSLSAAKFLERFVDPKIAWAHIDIAGAAWRKKASGTQIGNGPTGYGVRLLVDLAERIGKKK
ncbi:leucyl aminopeptidase family protein [Leptospira borgpetersenii]|uniref:Probable cytosol aminopeptidase n=1 Tax=Leptospira borgpetersenii str. Brem 328 TaxID=1049780 RepID=A0ABC9SEL0_LEPBO|nr:leucyl aminopeptidase [Leptospira borgpetersenii]EMN13325.1 cytosol aminopeptidase family, catalytic domain protein [Leptospira borgpetersenii str. Brem 307]EMN16161.1 cytosol aminopeptidase family, catalytic domain protein [Leptospira borgpetersenii str. Brem 328]